MPYQLACLYNNILNLASINVDTRHPIYYPLILQWEISRWPIPLMFGLLAIFGTNRYTIWGPLDVLTMFAVSTMQASCSKHATLGTPLSLQSRPFDWVPIAIAPLVFLRAT